MSQPERKWREITVVNEAVVSGKVMDGKLVRFIELAAYEELEREVERLTGVADTWQQSALNSECEIITLRQKLASTEAELSGLKAAWPNNALQNTANRLGADNAQLRELVRELYKLTRETLEKLK